MALIDTDVAIHLRDKDREVILRILSLPTKPALSIISRIELEGGAAGPSQSAAMRQTRLEALLRQLDIVGLSGDVVDAYRQIVAAQGYSRRKVFDRLIAATAIVNGLTLITINAADFRDIPGLSLEIWPAPAQ